MLAFRETWLYWKKLYLIKHENNELNILILVRIRICTTRLINLSLTTAFGQFSEVFSTFTPDAVMQIDYRLTKINDQNRPLRNHRNAKPFSIIYSNFLKVK